MSALKQYLDIYNEAAAMIDRGSVPLFNERRKTAFLRLSKMTLPPKGSENFEHTDMESVLAPDYGLNLSRIPVSVDPAQAFRCDVPNLSTSLFFLINDAPAETDTSRNKLPSGVIVGSLARAALDYPQIIAKYYGTLADTSNVIVSLNDLLVQNGFVLFIPAGVKLERPIQLVNIFEHNKPLMSCRRLLIVLEEGAEAQLIVCDHTQNPDNEFLSLQTVEIFAGKDSRFDYCDLEESSGRTSRLSSLYLHQDAGSNVAINGLTLFNGVTRNEYYATFAGKNAELSLCGMGIEDLERHLDTYTHITHESSDCKSRELFKYVADDNAVAAFCGKILVSAGASGTDARQNNRNILLSDSARIFSKPQLEIYNDDVSCSHGSSTGQLDPMQILYMRTRGLTLNDATTLLKQAFMSDVINSIRVDALRDRLRMLVERRFSGDALACTSCASSCKEQI